MTVAQARLPEVSAGAGQYDSILEVPLLLLVLEQFFEDMTQKEILLLIQAVHTGGLQVVEALPKLGHIHMYVDVAKELLPTVAKEQWDQVG